MLEICVLLLLTQQEEFCPYGVAALYPLRGYRRIVVLFSILVAVEFERTAVSVTAKGTEAFEGMTVVHSRRVASAKRFSWMISWKCIKVGKRDEDLPVSYRLSVRFGSNFRKNLHQILLEICNP